MLIRLLLLPLSLTANLLRLLRYALRMALFNAFARRSQVRSKLYLKLELEDNYALASTRPRGWLARSLEQPPPSLLTLRARLQAIAEDEAVDGVFVTVKPLGLGLARTAELVAMLDRLREAGKHVVVHVELATSKELLLASTADDLLLSPGGRLYTFSPRLDQLFAANALSRFGVRAQFIHMGIFKTASHQWLYPTMTAPQRLMMTQLHDRIAGIYRERLGARRQLEAREVDEALAQAPLTPRQAQVLGLIDGALYKSEFRDYLRHGDAVTPRGRTHHHAIVAEGDDAPTPAEDEDDLLVMPFEGYLQSKPKLDWRPMLRRSRKPRLAILDLSGVILQDSIQLPLSGSQEAILPNQVLPALEAIAYDDQIAGLLVHINSPGGSAQASDDIWHALEQVRALKPVVALLSDVAASGGYYIASAAEAIVCRPETLTGSIGVVAGKLVFSELWDKLGIAWDGVQAGDNAAIWSSNRAFSEAEWARLNRRLDGTYEDFTAKVAAGRGLSATQVQDAAKGQVWTGEDALALGLVDELGGLERAIALAAEAVEAEPGSVQLKRFPEERDPFQAFLEDTLGSAVQSPGTAALARRLAKLAQALAPLLETAERLTADPHSQSLRAPDIQGM